MTESNFDINSMIIPNPKIKPTNERDRMSYADHLAAHEDQAEEGIAKPKMDWFNRLPFNKNK